MTTEPKVKTMKIQIELTDEQINELLAEATDGMAPPLAERMMNNDTLRRMLIRNAIAQRMPQ